MGHLIDAAGRATRRLPARTTVVLATVALVGAIGYLAAGSLAQGATARGATVSLHKTRFGQILVDSSGRTLYLFARDRAGRSLCTATCARFWPPLLSKTRPVAGAGVKASLLGRTVRSNHTLQVTYDRHPLYTFALDKRAGQTTGQGRLAFGAKWWVVSARGTAVTKAAGGGATGGWTTTTTTTTPYQPSYP